ncbi:MAG: strawberry notch-like NTP hydrolase domain-containing protein, partial [Desulfomonilaceae bacterium]
GVRNGAVRNIGGSSGTDPGGDSSLNRGSNVSTVTIETKNGEVSEFSDSVFAHYTPQRLTIPGAQQHPGRLVQAAAMSAVEPPAPTYAPKLPANLIRDGLLSIAQLEAVVYAGQAHSDLLPNGSRKGFFIGDGTGVGKGREISGVILDNTMRGRNKAVWVSFNPGLIEDAKRDFSGVGGDPAKLFFQGKTKAGGEITQKEGILFTTYSTLRGGEKKQANDQGQNAGKTRAQQIIEWLGNDFDGVIAFDEAHSMGNAIAIKGKRGVRKPSQQAIAGINLQHELPHARVLYVSATGATEVSNLRYADRLGLWGEATPFADVNAFIEDVSRGGIASMELISRDMKALGMYVSRSLSYDGVSYERLEHTLTPLQEDIYNELAGAWQIVLNNVEEALKITQAGSNGNAKSAALSQFWGAHQRFFNQIITAMQTPRVIDDIRERLDAGNVAVIQLVNTNEAAQERIIADATANNAALEDLDFTPRQLLIDYVRNGFPVAAYEESLDESGNVVYVPVRDSEGNQVFDREAIALRDSLLETLQQIRVPENPLDSIINSFGSDRVAEVTGRSRRFVQIRDDEGNLKIVEEKRGKNASMTDAESFQNNNKDILIFSGAGGTGYSFHADNTAENQRKRIHYILQPGWQADKAVQGFGRTHRTNQAQEPHYVLPTTNLKAQKRFVSSIARRLDQLGALTRGQREATSQGIFTASDNLESEHASTALKNLFGDLYREKTSLPFQDLAKQMGLNLLDENGSLSESKIPSIPQFLNRLLSLKTDMQNAVFAEFEKRLVEAVEYSKQQGLYDVGLQTLKALSIEKTRDDVVHVEKNTGAQTRYVELAVTNKIEYEKWEDAKLRSLKRRETDDLSNWFVSEFGNNKGDIFYLRDIGERLDSDGNSVRRGVVYSIRKNDHKYIDNADEISRGEAYRNVDGSYRKVTLTRSIDEVEAEKLWKEQTANAPKTITKSERMIVGVILPIWDRVEGSEIIKRLQTDDGEQLLGRMLTPKASKQTLKNLGLDSGLSNMSASDLFSSIKNGSKAILSNGWEISTAKVNYEDRIEIKGRSSLTDAEKRVLKDQGAFIERISWAERVFIPTGEDGIAAFERITALRPVVDLIGKNQSQSAAEIENEYGIPEILPGEVFQAGSGGDSMMKIKNAGDSRVSSMNNQKKLFHETVAERLIEQLKAGTAPWQKPWRAGEPNALLPINPTTGKRYKGINAIELIMEGRGDPRWMTYKQAETAGYQVRRGEKGTRVQYWKFSEEKTRHDEEGEPVLDAEGKPVKEEITLERPRAFFATVFNAEQIDGVPVMERKPVAWNSIDRAEGILQASGAAINHSGGNRAFYRLTTDTIHLPGKTQFGSADRYYATALHELGHWTGHENRLNRDLGHPFGSEAYAREELRAEIASMILGDELGIGHDPGQHAAYVASWIKVLEDDPLEVFRAAAAAEKIQEFVLGLEQKRVRKLETRERDATIAVIDEQEIAGRVIVEIERAMENTAYWEDQAAADEVTQMAQSAVRSMREGAYEGALMSLEDAGVLEERYAGISGPTFQGAAGVLKAEWETLTIKVRNAKREHEEAIGMAQLQEEPAMTAIEEEGIGQEKIYLNVPFEEKEKVKSLGARWDKNLHAWFIPPGVDPESFAKWGRGAVEGQGGTQAHRGKEERQYLAVPYGEREAAKALGAKWDKAAKCWYVGPDGDAEKLSRWLPENVPGQRQAAAMSPPEEFADALRSVGALVVGGHPIMDGKRHRIAVTGDKKGEQAGFYVAHLDGHPAGYIKNNRTGVEIRWKSKGYVLSPEEKAGLLAQAAENVQVRAVNEQRRHEQTAQRIALEMTKLIAVSSPTTYLENKQITVQAGIFTDSEGKKTYVPAHDENGKVWTMQYTWEDGTKRFAKNSLKVGCFHAVGGMDELAKAPAIVIAEGYATACSLSEALGFSTVAAFDSGNLPAVARALRGKFPDKPIIIAGDNDLHLESQGVNPGRTKAQAAARAVSGTAMFPIFAPGEQTSDSKAFKDFNDLATKSILGKDGLERQVKAVVSAAIEKQQAKTREAVIELAVIQEATQRQDRQARGARR